VRFPNNSMIIRGSAEAVGKILEINLKSSMARKDDDD
jgi:hypothetical protein